MLKPTLEIVNVGPDLYEVHIYVSSTITIVSSCNGYALQKVILQYLDTEK